MDPPALIQLTNEIAIVKANSRKATAMLYFEMSFQKIDL